MIKQRKWCAVKQKEMKKIGRQGQREAQVNDRGTQGIQGSE